MSQELISLFQNENVEVTTQNNSNVDQDSIKAAALSKLKIKEIAVMLQDISWDDRYEWLIYQKNKANRLFYQEKYHQAIQIYSEMSAGLYMDPESEGKTNIMKQEFQMPILSNLALCYKKLKQNAKAAQFFDMAIKEDPSPLYVLRKANFLFHIDEVDESLALLKSVKQYHQYHEEAQKLLEQIHLRQQRQKHVYQKMFETGKTLTEPSIPTEIGLLNKLYEKFKSIFISIFGCKRIFVDDDSDTDDPAEFLAG